MVSKIHIHLQPDTSIIFVPTEQCQTQCSGFRHSHSPNLSLSLGNSHFLSYGSNSACSSTGNSGFILSNAPFSKLAKPAMFNSLRNFCNGQCTTTLNETPQLGSSLITINSYTVASRTEKGRAGSHISGPNAKIRWTVLPTHSPVSTMQIQ
jgi:hypothetical protein